MSWRPRAREIGIRIGRLAPGPTNSLLDVAGVAVGHVSLIRGEGRLVPGQGPVRTGVTAILPHQGNLFREKVAAGVHVINGFSKCAGLVQLRELGSLETPLVLTNTLSVAAGIEGVLDHVLAQNEDIGVTTGTANAVVCECNDSYLNDIRGRHVRREHVVEAIRRARRDACPEGCVGAGVGMSAYGYKAGIGSASRVIPRELGGFTVGVLALTNCGSRGDLVVDGVPVGAEMAGRADELAAPGSAILVVATDGPLAPDQLTRLARRAVIGLVRTGYRGTHGSGDVALAFSTTNRFAHYPDSLSMQTGRVVQVRCLDYLFEAAAEGVEEAVIDSLLRAETTHGRDGNVREELPVESLLELLRRHGRLQGV